MGKYIIDVDTGVIGQKLYEGDRITRVKTQDVDTVNVDIKCFVKLNIEEVIPLLPTLSYMEQALLINMIPYISYKTCCLQYSNGKDINLESIIDITGMAKQTVINTIQGLISKDIFYKGRNSKNNQYFVNPWIANRGMTVNKVLKQMFKNYKIKSMGNIKWDDLKTM